MTGKVNRMIPGIFISYMIGMVVSCLTQESLAPSLGMGVALLFFLLILGSWISYYRTQMMELSGMLEAEYWDYEEAQVREPELCVDS